MLIVSLIWVIIGVIAGLLSVAARLGFPGRNGWKLSVVLGAGAALIGGWLGTLVFSRLYGTPTALWVSALAVAVVPWASTRLRRRLAALAARHPSATERAEG